MEFWSFGVLERWGWHLHVVRIMELGTGPNCVFRFSVDTHVSEVPVFQHSSTPVLQHSMV
jgi:hypothetical protein